MAIKSGSFLTVGNGFVIDRIQTGGVSSLNIPEEKIHELGNWESVGVVRDIPDLSFDLESLDVSCEVEALLTGEDPTSLVDGQEFDFIDTKPIDIISPFKVDKGLYTIDKGIIVPYLTLESVTYRFGIRQNATQQFTLRGDSIYYVPGSVYYETFSGDGVTTVFNPTRTADLPFSEAGNVINVVGVCYVRSNGSYKRLFYGTDYTDTAGAVTFLVAPPAGSTIKIAYGSSVVATYPQSVHPDTSVKPATVRSQHLDVYLGTNDATPTFTRWTGVQSFEVTRRVTLDNDEEFGNTHYVAQDYDVAEVSGSISMRAADLDALWDKIAEVADVGPNETIGPNTSVTLPLELRARHPDTGDVIKTWYTPDARLQVPAMQGRANSKLETVFPWSSDSGQLLVYNGER